MKGTRGMVKALAGGRRSVVVLAVLLNVAALCVSAASSGADVTSVKGSACGYYTNVGLFGGPQAKLGCEPQQGQSFASASASTRSPSVTLPPTGSATPITETDVDGAAGVYGPAVIFGGIWPEHVSQGPPSGPITVSTQGTTGANGKVTSFTDIKLRDPANPDSPGGFGPIPVWGDSLHVECTATETTVTGKTTFTNSFIAKATDNEGNPLADQTETIPAEPPPNYTKHGIITNVGDVFTAVFNEQIVNEDGSLTVNAVHMYLYGPVAVGDMVKGQATCGTTPTTIVPKDTKPPTCGVKVVALEPPTGDAPGPPMVPRQELIGVFDAGGLQSITNVQVTNGTVTVPPNGTSYLEFNPGQKGPLTLTAKRTDESQDMTWSFDATDKAGNKSHCDGTGSPATDPTDDTTTSTTTTTVAGGSGGTTTSTTTTTQAASGSTTTTSTTQGTGTTTTTRAATANTTAQSTGTTTTTTRPAGTSTAAANTTATQVAVALTG